MFIIFKYDSTDYSRYMGVWRIPVKNVIGLIYLIEVVVACYLLFYIAGLVWIKLTSQFFPNVHRGTRPDVFAVFFRARFLALCLLGLRFGKFAEGKPNPKKVCFAIMGSFIIALVAVYVWLFSSRDSLPRCTFSYQCPMAEMSCD